MKLLHRIAGSQSILFLLCFLASGAPGFSQSVRQMALTFDDLPLGGPALGIEELESMNDRILASLARFRAPVLGLVNEQKLIVPGEIDRRAQLLLKWIDAGAELGNHTFSHPSLNRVSPTDFIEDVLRGETISTVLLATRGRKPVYFRHPFLHTGQRHQERDQVESFLARRGYRIAPVTMENADWLFNIAWLEARAKQDPELVTRVEQAYLDYSLQMIDFFEGAAGTVLGGPIPHVMLLHSNLLNAALLDELLERIQARGYRFIKVEQALTDPAYSRSDNYLGEAGPSWIFRWDVGDGKRDVDWRQEPVPPPFVHQLYRSGRGVRGEE